MFRIDLAWPMKEGVGKPWGKGRELTEEREVGNWLTAGLSGNGMDFPDIPNKRCNKGVNLDILEHLRLKISKIKFPQAPLSVDFLVC